MPMMTCLSRVLRNVDEMRLLLERSALLFVSLAVAFLAVRYLWQLYSGAPPGSLVTLF